jgi:hypothetical protein
VEEEGLQRHVNIADFEGFDAMQSKKVSRAQIASGMRRSAYLQRPNEENDTGSLINPSN